MPLEHSKLGVIFNLDSQTWTVTIERGDPASCSTKEEAAEERKYLKRETRERDRPRGYSRRLPRTIQPLSPILTHFSPLPCVCREGERNDFPPRFKGIPLGTLGSIRRRMRPTIRESMRRVCISIRRRRTRRGTSVREQEEKRDYW